VGVLINTLSAALGTLFFYLIFFVSPVGSLVLWILIAAFFSGMIMVLIPLQEVKNR
jgi:hypothetical protein